ncbi:hypothetical protein CBR_g1111 [Chara braunii]|uniref:Uncharacterized protein n=1 Tax=Chara braunii TaxID=69332 RepID=A0A388KD56_CHABU|nr:hypothetical protein CBR_g1111 [Chara braunii]|eukprot:GBG67992.1 hypothetical protein CBR_g1111 [Chara braunii]
MKELGPVKISTVEIVSSMLQTVVVAARRCSQMAVLCCRVVRILVGGALLPGCSDTGGGRCDGRDCFFDAPDCGGGWSSLLSDGGALSPGCSDAGGGCCSAGVALLPSDDAASADEDELQSTPRIECIRGSFAAVAGHVSMLPARLTDAYFGIASGRRKPGISPESRLLLRLKMNGKLASHDGWDLSNTLRLLRLSGMRPLS